MKYLTKEWYTKSQLTGLHYGLKVHPKANSTDIYDRLYNIKERAFIKMEQEVYNTDPRFMLGENLIQSIHLDDIPADKIIVIERSEDEVSALNTLIEKYDNRPPFNTELCRQKFREQLEWKVSYLKAQLPSEIIVQINDFRVFALGYCTSEIYAALKRVSLENERHTRQVMEQLASVSSQQDIPDDIKNKFNFHDCKVLHIEKNSENKYIIQLDASGGFTHYNKITFIDAEVMLEEPNIVGASWIYDEIYSTTDGFEVHVLLHGQALCELTLHCKTILIEQS